MRNLSWGERALQAENEGHRFEAQAFSNMETLEDFVSSVEDNLVEDSPFHLDTLMTTVADIFKNYPKTSKALIADVMEAFENGLNDEGVAVADRRDRINELVKVIGKFDI